jgi:hypothetical protein
MGWMPPETVEGLIEDLRAEGLDAQISYEEIPGGGPLDECCEDVVMPEAP